MQSPTSSAASSGSSRPRDIEVFLASYPDQPASGGTANLEFYSGKRKMRPENVTFGEFMHAYEDDLEQLEANHAYIQWMFPIRERGVNHLAQPLTAAEINAMSNDPEISKRQLRAYTMMLRFYGIDFNDGRLARSADWQSRFRNLQRNQHNFLRITRILKHLSEFDFLQPHAAPLVLFFTAQHGDGRFNLTEGTTAGSGVDRWWANCFRHEGERQMVREIVMTRGQGGRWGEKEWTEWMAAYRPDIGQDNYYLGQKPA